MIEGLRVDKNLYSFDLFDTLVSRPLKRPVYLFDLVEHTGYVSYRFPLFSLAGFRFWRMLAERVVRLFSRREDIQIKRIYRLLGWIIRQPSRTLRQELRLEFNLIRSIPEHVAILRDLVAQGKRCCIITDMYLPPWFIRKIIRRHVGVDVDFFSSSHHGVTKASGKLFRVVANHYRLDYCEMAHVGDNPHSDLSMPRQLGMDAHKVPERTLADSPRSLFELFTAGEDTQSTFSRVGYSLVGPLCISFAMFIKRDTERRGIHKVFFGARDGYLIKEAFDLIKKEGTESRYLRISRRVLYVPAFAFDEGHEKFFEGRVSADEFFERLGLQTPPHLRDLDPVRHRELFEKELESMNFREHSLAEAEVLADYLRQNEFAESVAFVDLGWRGSSQDSLATILGNGCKIQGYYFGTIVEGEDKTAYYFKNCLPLKRFSRVFQSIPVFEFLFTEPTTSLKNIRRHGDEFRFENLNDESQAQILAREEIARGCRRFLADFEFVARNLQLDDEKIRRQLDRLIHKFLYRPDAELIREFEDITHSEGFGGSKVAKIISREPFSLSSYRNAYWRGAYVSLQNGLQGILARTVHAIAQSGIVLFLLHKSYRLRQLIDRLTT